MLFVLIQFLYNWSQYVVVDGFGSKLVIVVSGVPQISVMGSQLFLMFTTKLFSMVENKLYGYADDSTLVGVVPTPGERVAVTDSMNRDLNRINMFCELWGMKSSARKSMSPGHTQFIRSQPY